MSLHDIPDGRPPVSVESDEAYDGINILGTPLSSPEFLKWYLHGKLEKHKLLLDFITDVAKMGLWR